MLKFDGKKVISLLEYVGRGLALHHFNIKLNSDDTVHPMILTEKGHAAWLETVNGYTLGQTVSQNLGRGTVVYEGARAPDDPKLTIWIVSMYGGLILSDAEHQGREDTSTIMWLVTGPPELRQTFAPLKW
jgi:hypothetical protein